jgi:RHS repeat-associated protein
VRYGNAQYFYSPRGELNTKIEGTDTTRYTYDALGNLVVVMLPHGDRIEYLIDGKNRRVGKKLNGVTVKRWIYDGDLRPVAEVDSAGRITARFVYAEKPNVAEYIVKGGVTYRVITDNLGSPRLIVDALTGNVMQRMDFDEFGNVVGDSNPDFTPFGFSGGIYEAGTKLVRLGARDYDASAGRWMSRDPLLFDMNQWDVYLYVGSDPINGFDPEGLVNWTKLKVAAANYAMGGMRIALGIGKLAVAAGMTQNPAFGTPGSALTAASGLFNLYSGQNAFLRGLRQFREALTESPSDASARNYLGLLPGGDRFDDPHEDPKNISWLKVIGETFGMW